MKLPFRKWCQFIPPQIFHDCWPFVVLILGVRWIPLLIWQVHGHEYEQFMIKSLKVEEDYLYFLLCICHDIKLPFRFSISWFLHPLKCCLSFHISPWSSISPSPSCTSPLCALLIFFYGLDIQNRNRKIIKLAGALPKGWNMNSWHLTGFTPSFQVSLRV